MRTLPDHITDLNAVFGESPGEDRVLISWDSMCNWLDDITSESPYLASQSLGESTDGRDLRLIIASSPNTLRTLDSVTKERRLLIDASRYLAIGSHDGAVSKPVVLITAGIHADEVGGVQMMPRFILDLATDSRYIEILNKLIVLVVPTLNPDGMHLVHEWYQKTLGTPAEGTNPPALYHRYAGHDNNRDWYQRHLQETRVIIDEVHRVWMPHVVIDLHQMGQKSPRYVVPPYIDPVEPHVHPLIYQLAGELGSRIATDHARAGNNGVCSGVMFDCYSPTRAYQHYHGGVRILAEAASAGIATPIDISADVVNGWADSPSLVPSVHMPRRWQGETWRLADIIHLHRQTVDTVLQAVAATPEQWLADQWRIFSDQAHSQGAFVLPQLKHQIDPAATGELIDLLRNGDVEVFVSEGNGETPSGSFVIPLQQPFGSYASALLSHTEYPEGQQAYDVTSHCLPIHMGVEVELLKDGYVGDLREPTVADWIPFEPAQAADVFPGAWLLIDPRSRASINLVNHALKAGSNVQRLQKPQLVDHRLVDAGTWVITDSSTWDILAHASRMRVRTTVSPALDATLQTVQAPRIGIYNPQHQSISDYGWLSLWLENAGFRFVTLTGEDIIHGWLDTIETLLFPHGQPELLKNQHAEQLYPAEYTRGLSERVSTALRTWLHRGGHMIAFEGAVTALCQTLNIELLQPLMKLSESAIHSSGVVAKIHPTNCEVLILGITEPFPAMYFSPHGYELHDTAHQQSAAIFSRDDTIISGRMHGGKRLQGLHAVVQITIGDGHFTAFAFRPHFRTQMSASEQMLTNAIMQTAFSQGIST